MALSSEERKHWESVVGLTRAHPPERRFAESFRRSTILAVAHHLAACESLLREIDDCLLNVNFAALPEDGHTTLNYDVARDWQERVADLLGREKWWLTK